MDGRGGEHPGTRLLLVNGGLPRVTFVVGTLELSAANLSRYMVDILPHPSPESYLRSRESVYHFRYLLLLMIGRTTEREYRAPSPFTDSSHSTATYRAQSWSSGNTRRIECLDECIPHRLEPRKLPPSPGFVLNRLRCFMRGGRQLFSRRRAGDVSRAILPAIQLVDVNGWLCLLLLRPSSFEWS